MDDVHSRLNIKPSRTKQNAKGSNAKRQATKSIGLNLRRHTTLYMEAFITRTVQNLMDDTSTRPAIRKDRDKKTSEHCTCKLNKLGTKVHGNSSLCL